MNFLIPDKKLSDNEIIEALEYCTQDKCHECSYLGKGCKILRKDALSLITRQKAEIEKNENIIRLADKTISTQKSEIERLEEKNSNLTSDLTSLQNDLTSAKAEIERLEKMVQELIATNENLEIACAENKVRTVTQNFIKAEAYKEFAERLKELPYIPNRLNLHKAYDNLLEEMVGDNDA